MVREQLPIWSIHDNELFDADTFDGLNTPMATQRSIEIIDGPMLRHGLQEMHGRRLVLPNRASDQPDPERINARYMDFINVDIGVSVQLE